MKKLLFLVHTVMLTVLVATPALAAQVQAPAGGQSNTTFSIPRPSLFPDVRIGNIIAAVLGILLIVAAIAAFLFLILGGLQWITSGGDKAGLESARNKITSAIVGLIIVAAAWAIIILLGQFVGVDVISGVTIPTILNP